MKELLKHLRDGGTLVTDAGQELVASEGMDVTYMLDRLANEEWRIKPEYEDGIYMGNRAVLLVRKDGHWHRGHGPTMSKRDINGFTTFERIGDLPRPYIGDPTFKPDWSDRGQAKWALEYDHARGRYATSVRRKLEHISNGHFRTEEDALAAAKELGK